MRAALQFLTIVPIPAPAVAPGAAAVWFPLVGALIGLAAAAAWHSPLGATAAILTTAVLTGGLHEDGLADVCDAVRAGRSRERMLEILKDSRIGAYGAMAIVLSILVRWQAMSMLPPEGIWWQFVLVHAAARASMVALAASTPAAAPGLGEAFRSSLPAWAAPFAVAQTLAALFFLPGGWRVIAAVAISVFLIRLYFQQRLGGFTGDGLGFQCQIAEAAGWVVLAWR